MNDERFDAMLRQLGAARSRRGALRIFGSAVLATAATAVFGTGTARAVLCPWGQICCGPGGLLGSIVDCLSGGGTCVNPEIDANNCGGCGNACTSHTCINGVCSNAPASTTSPPPPPGGGGGTSGQQGNCPEGQTWCIDKCTDTTSDAGNCGACKHLCPLDQNCINSTCMGCPAGQTACPNNLTIPGHPTGAYICVDTQTDNTHCGGCNKGCPGTPCTNGTCGSPCSAGQTWCGPRDGCVDLQTDFQNCGDCGNACLTDGKCVNGTCTGCPGWQTMCGGTCVDTKTSLQYCGGCNGGCLDAPPGSNGLVACCDGKCVDIHNDNNHCGDCGDFCDPGIAHCDNGTCVPG